MEVWGYGSPQYSSTPLLQYSIFEVEYEYE